MMKIIYGIDFSFAAAECAIIYLVTSSVCMMILRKWRSDKNIYGCMGVSILTACIQLFAGRLEYGWCTQKTAAAEILLLIISVFLTGREIFKYMREDEEQIWNLCYNR